MSLLPPDLVLELSQLLQALQSADNTIRSQAEDHLQNNWTVPRPDALLMGLAEQVGSQASNSVRTSRHVRKRLFLAPIWLQCGVGPGCRLAGARFGAQNAL